MKDGGKRFLFGLDYCRRVGSSRSPINRNCYRQKIAGIKRYTRKKYRRWNSLSARFTKMLFVRVEIVC